MSDLGLCKKELARNTLNNRVIETCKPIRRRIRLCLLWARNPYLSFMQTHGKKPRNSTSCLALLLARGMSMRCSRISQAIASNYDILCIILALQELRGFECRKTQLQESVLRLAETVINSFTAPCRILSEPVGLCSWISLSLGLAF